MYGYIYKTTNLINGKIYIGQHRCYKSKYKKDSDYYGSGVHLLKAINKYGKENFKNEIIEECFNEKDLNEKEIYWIAYYNSMDNDIGYNMTPGGQDFSWVTKKVDCFDVNGDRLATYDSISEAVRILGLSGTNKVSACCRGKRKLVGGYQFRYHNPLNEFIDSVNTVTDRGTAISQYTLDGKWLNDFNNVAEAADYIGKAHNGTARRKIKQACNGELDSAYDYIWKWHKRSETAALADLLNLNY